MPPALLPPQLEPTEAPDSQDDPTGQLEAAASVAAGNPAPPPPLRNLEIEEGHTSVMVALYPSATDAEAIAIEGGEDADELHVTLTFHGKAAEVGDRDEMAAVVREWAENCPPLEGEVSGVGMFLSGPSPVTYASLDLPQLPTQRELLVQALKSAGFPPDTTHGFTPHMTLDYARRRPSSEALLRPITFERVTLAWADEHISIPLSGKATLQEARARLALLEAGHWDPKKHPRWPKGTPRAGEFMKVGQTFSVDGKEWEIAHMIDGKVVAHRTGGGYNEVETRTFDPKDTPGPDNEMGGIKQTSQAVIGGKEKSSTVTLVDPYVDHDSHDASIKQGDNSPISDEEWERFGELDQRYYTELMGRFGKHSPGAASTLVAAAYKDYEQAVQDLVKQSYQGQYGSSTGSTLSFASIFNYFKKTDKPDQKLIEKREKALELQGRLKDVYAWDLYNRTRSPDLTVFHRDTNPLSFWEDNFIKGDKAIMSGLSQSFSFGSQSLQQFGPNVIATPLSIRHVVMSSYSAQPVPGETHFPGELEISVASQLKVDGRSLTFTATPQQHKWLSGMTTQPQGGTLLEQFRGHLKGEVELEMPPADAEISMVGKSYVDPEPSAANVPGVDDSKLPPIKNEPYAGKDLPKEIPWEHTDANGVPEARVAKTSGYQAGDYMMGMKGTLYWIGPDPGDPFGLRYHKIVDGKFTGESWNFEGGGSNTYYKIKGNHPAPKPKEIKFDGDQWANSTDKKLIGKFEPGEKFKVHGNSYEVVGKMNDATSQIVNLDNGMKGTINNDYKATVLVPKGGVEIPEAGDALKPAKGLTFSRNGKKHTITNIKKDGTISAKPSGGGKVVQLAPDEIDNDKLFDPSAWTAGEKIEVGELDVGSVFHGGAGSTVRPYRITGHKGNKVEWENLDTGKTGTFLAHKNVSMLLSPDEVDEAHPGPPTEVVAYDKLKKGDPAKISDLGVGDQFTEGGELYEVTGTEIGPEGNILVAQVKGGITGPDAKEGVFPDKIVAFHAKAEDPKPDAVDYALAGAASSDLPDAVQAAGFDPYKSTYGSGGKYKHHKVSEMGEGVVFRDKTGTVWKVKTAGGAPVITDGKKNYKVDGALRGRVLDDADFTDSSPPIAHTDAEVPAAAAAVGLMPNTDTKVEDLPVGAIFQSANGQVFEVEELASGDASDENLGLMKAKNLTNGEPQFFGSAIKPAMVKMPAKDSSEQTVGDLNPGDNFTEKGETWKVVSHSTVGSTSVVQLVKSGHLKQVSSDQPAFTGLSDNEPAAPTPPTLGGLKLDDVFYVDGKGWIVTETANPGGGVEVMSVDDVDDEEAFDALPQTMDAATPVSIVPPGWVPKEPDADDHAIGDYVVTQGGSTGEVSGHFTLPGSDVTYYQIEGTTGYLFTGDELVDEDSLEPEGASHLQDLLPGQTFEAGGAKFEVVAHAGDGETIYKGTDGSIHKEPSTAPLGNLANVSDPPETADPAPAAVAPEAYLKKAGLSQENLAPAPVKGYASKWGSGGKYQHPRVDELAAGDQFRGSGSKTVWTVMAIDNGVAIVQMPDGTHQIISDLGMRVRKL